MKEWMGEDLSGLDIMVVQIDGIHISEHLVPVAALGIDSEGIKHPLGLMEGATEHSAVVQALIDDLIERGLDPAVPRLFIIDGSKALAKAIRRNFGRQTPIQRCQIHKARNIMEVLSPALHGIDPACVAPGLRSLACTNIIENMMGTVRRVTRNVKRWSSPSMALRWTAAAMHEAKKGFRRLKAFRQLPALRAALATHYAKEINNCAVAQTAKAA
jgi:putative transposase